MRTTGSRLWELKRPMLADAVLETPICRKPNMADSLPIFRSKGTSASAAAFGKASPRLDNETNSNASVDANPNQP